MSVEASYFQQWVLMLWLKSLVAASRSITRAGLLRDWLNAQVGWSSVLLRAWKKAQVLSLDLQHTQSAPSEMLWWCGQKLGQILYLGMVTLKTLELGRLTHCCQELKASLGGTGSLKPVWPIEWDLSSSKRKKQTRIEQTTCAFYVADQMEATSFQPDLGKDGCQTADFLFPISAEENLPNFPPVNSGGKLRGSAHFNMAKMNFY